MRSIDLRTAFGGAARPAFAGLAILLAFATPAAANDFPDLAPATVTATSTLKSPTDHYAAWHPFVDKAAEEDRLWCEGKADEGIGEALVLTFGAPTKLDAIEMSAGVWKTDALFRANNLVTAIDVTTDDGRKLAFAFPEERKAVEVKLGGAPVKQLRFAIAKVKKGKMNDSCISGVKLTFPGDTQLLVGADRAPPLTAAIEGVRQALSDCDETALRTRLKFPFTNKPPNSDNEKPKYKTYANVKDLVKACKKREVWGKEGDFEQHWFKTETPGTITIGSYPNMWKLVLESGAWKVVLIEDNNI
jgi:hypothetical protein